MTPRPQFTDGTPRWEVPLKINAPSGGNQNRLYEVEFTNEPAFSFRVVRKSSGTVLFDTCLGGFTFADQFLQFSTRLPSRNLYGIGENEQHTFRHSFEKYPNYPLWARDEPPGVRNQFISYTPYILSFCTCHCTVWRELETCMEYNPTTQFWKTMAMHIPSQLWTATLKVISNSEMLKSLQSYLALMLSQNSTFSQALVSCIVPLAAFWTCTSFLAQHLRMLCNNILKPWDALASLLTFPLDSISVDMGTIPWRICKRQWIGLPTPESHTTSNGVTLISWTVNWTLLWAQSTLAAWATMSENSRQEGLNSSQFWFI